MFTTAPVHPRDTRYDELRSGFNLSVDHHPAAVIEATNSADVVAAVALAEAQQQALAVMNTGHGPSIPADGAVLVRTGSMNEVTVDAARRTALLHAGSTWGDVIAATTPHGLAPLNGTSPAVGAVGYTLGGGVGPLGRRFGFAADHVRRLDVVTADGRLRRVRPTGADADLFWALRGAGPSFGVVVAMEIDLFPIATLYGGEVCFGPDSAQEVLHAYAQWAPELPETLSSSLLILHYPDDEAVPNALRGRHITHLRVASSSEDHGQAHELTNQLRAVGSVLADTARPMSYAEVGTIHHEPTDTPVAAFDRHVLLADLDHDAASTIAHHTEPAATLHFLTELRAWGGALARPPEIANAVGTRDTAYSLLAISDPTPGHRAARDDFLTAMEPWTTGMAYPNFCGVDDTTEVAARSYQPDDLTRLRAIKTAYDPKNLFRVNFNITPAQ